ncbi:T-cell activation inhibitor, mitochondrial isoform X8 [Dasypus novemcinctus]|uniref:T-cell activation inhibitor, mitochondrial isoform X8 n=1 Tax=Dasypus novemcinctus TaxID=9361 RepID=UPI00062A73EC|nr:T-cell activation inhibitor, mitochondrial isoform X8 [Dasypus novemcinctus]
MFCHLRPMRRFYLEKVFPHWFLSSRALSGAEAVNALRPFYFVVHPDFFGQHPREREVNENSLKRLSVYLENLQKPGFRSLKPTQLTFYIRETDQNSSDGQEPFSTTGFRTVKFTLHTRDLLSTVLDILNSCSLSTEHIQNLNINVHSQPLKEAKRISDRPIKWSKSYYSFTGFKDPEEDLEQVSRMETTLMWQRSWGVAHRCSQLHSLGRLAQQNLDILKNAKGCTIIFTDRSGVSAVGHVMLGTMDVHHHWTKEAPGTEPRTFHVLFERLPSYFDLQKKLMLLEDQISYLLGGIQVVYIEELQPVLTLEEYYSLLDVFYNRLLKSRIPFHPRSLRGLQMILNSDRYAPSLHDLGHFNIPTLCDPANLQWFILTKAQQARENMKRKEELKVLENELIQASTKKFSLEKLYKEPGVSSVQMVDCCKRLLELSLPYLQGMHLCVSHFYSVMQDGDLCIPWNWKNGDTVK